MYNLRYFKNKEDYAANKDSFIETTISCVNDGDEHEIYFKLDPLSVIKFDVDLEYNKTLALAKGETLTPFVKFSQTLMDDKGVTSTITGDTNNLPEGVIITYTSDIVGMNTESGVITVPPRGIEVGDKKTLGNVNVIITVNGVSKTDTVTLYQEENIVEKSEERGGELVYDDIIIPSIDIATIHASGGTLSVSIPSATQDYSVNDTIITYTYTSEATSEEIISNSGATLTILPSKFIVKGSALSKGVNPSDKTEVVKETISWVGYGNKVASQEIVIYQDANTIINSEYMGGETTYGDVEMGIVEEGIILASGGDGVTYIGNGKQSYFTSEYIKKNTYSSRESDYITEKEAINGINEVTPTISELHGSALSKGVITSDTTIITSTTVSWDGSDNKSVSKEVFLYQEENHIVDEETAQGEIVYGEVVKGTVTNATIDASGGSATATATYGTQEWTTDASTIIYTYTSGDQKEEELTDNRGGINKIQPTYNILSAYAESKGRDESDITEVDSVVVEWLGNDNQSASDTMYVYQAANKLISTVYSNPSGISVEVEDIKAKGGTVTKGTEKGKISQTKTLTYTSGVYTDTLNPTYTIKYSNEVSALSLNDTIKERTKVGELNYTYTANGKSTSNKVDVYQEANELISSTEDLQCEPLVKGTVTNQVIKASGGSAIATATNGSQKYTATTTNTYTAGVFTASTSGTKEIIAYPSSIEGSAISRETTPGDVKNIKSAVVRWESLNGEDVVTESMTITQEANIETITDVNMVYSDITKGKVTITPQLVDATGGTAIVSATDGKQNYEEITSYEYTSLKTRTAITSSGTISVQATVNPSTLTFNYVEPSVTVQPTKTATVEWSKNGKKVSEIATAKQELQRVVESGTTYTYGNVIKGKVTDAFIPASGGTRTATIGNGSQAYTAVTWTKYHTGAIIENEPIYGTNAIKPSFDKLTANIDSKMVTESEQTIVTSDTVVWLGEDGKSASQEVFVYQDENKKMFLESGVTMFYGPVVIGQIQNVKDVHASGDTFTVTATNGSQAYTAYTAFTYIFDSNETLTTTPNQESGTNAVEPSPKTWNVNVSSLGTTTQNDRKLVSSQTFTWLGNGEKSDSEVAKIYQLHNVVEKEEGGTITYSNVTNGNVTVSGIILAKGGSVTVSATNGSQVKTTSEVIITYTSGATARTANQSSETLTVLPSQSSVIVTAQTLGTTVTAEEKLISSITINYVGKDGKSNSKSVDVKQEINRRTVNNVSNIYANFTCGTIEATPTTIDVTGGTSTIKVTDGSEKWSAITTYDYTSESQSSAVTDNGTNTIKPTVNPSNLKLTFTDNTGNSINVTKKATATWVGESDSCTREVSVTQSSRKLVTSETRYTWGTVTAGSITSPTIAASGGTKTATAANGSQPYTAKTYNVFDDGTEELTNTSNGTSAITPNHTSASATGDNLGCTPKAKTTLLTQEVEWRGGNSKTASGTMYVYQEENKIEDAFYRSGITYNAPTVSIGTGMTAAGGSATVTHSVSNTVTYYHLYTSKCEDPKSSGRTGTSTIKITSNGNNRFSLNGNTLSHSTMGTNETTDKVVITATNEDDKTKTATAEKSIENKYVTSSITYNWGALTKGTAKWSGDILAKGSTITASATNGSQPYTATTTMTYTSGDHTSQTKSTSAISATKTAGVTSITKSSLGTTYKCRTVQDYVTYKWTGGGTNNTGSSTVSGYQEANVITTLDAVATTSATNGKHFAYSTTSIGASGGNATIITQGQALLTFTSGGQVRQGSGDAYGGTFTFSRTYSGSGDGFTLGSDGKVTAADRDKTTGTSRCITVTSVLTISYKVTGNCGSDKSDTLSDSIQVCQEANTCTLSYGTPNGVTLTVSDIPAAGGTVSAGTLSSTTCKQQVTSSYTSNATSSETKTVTYSGGSYSTKVTAGTLSTTIKDRTKIDTLTYTYKANGKNGTASADVYQAKNEVTNSFYNTGITYGTPTVSIGNGLTAGGGSATVTHSVSNTVSYYYKYTSGDVSAKKTSARTGTSSIKITSDNNSRFSLDGNTLKHSTMGTNVTTDKVVITATNKDDATKTNTDAKSITNAITGTTYGTPSGLTLTVEDIKAGGSTVSSGTIGGTCKQEATYSYDAGANLSSATISVTYTGSYSTPVSAGTRGTLETPRTKIGKLTYTYTANSKSNSCSADVYQAENYKLYLQGEGIVPDNGYESAINGLAKNTDINICIKGEWVFTSGAHGPNAYQDCTKYNWNVYAPLELNPSDIKSTHVKIWNRNTDSYGGSGMVMATNPNNPVDSHSRTIYYK